MEGAGQFAEGWARRVSGLEIVSLISSLSSPQGFWEAIEYCGEIAVLAGVVLEYRAESVVDKKKYLGAPGSAQMVMSFGTSDADEFRRRRVRRATWILVAGLVIALVGIIKTNRLSDERIAQLNVAAAEGNARAAEAEKGLEDERTARSKLEAKVADRGFSDAQFHAFRGRLKPLGSHRVDIFVVEPGQEPEYLSFQTYAFLGGAGWPARRWDVSGWPVAGILVETLKGASPSEKAAADQLGAVFDMSPQTGAERLNDMPELLPSNPPWGWPFHLSVTPALVGNQEKWDSGKAAPIRIIIGSKE